VLACGDGGLGKTLQWRLCITPSVAPIKTSPFFSLYSVDCRCLLLGHCPYLHQPPGSTAAGAFDTGPASLGQRRRIWQRSGGSGSHRGGSWGWRGRRGGTSQEKTAQGERAAGICCAGSGRSGVGQQSGGQGWQRRQQGRQAGDGRRGAGGGPGGPRGAACGQRPARHTHRLPAVCGQQLGDADSGAHRRRPVRWAERAGRLEMCGLVRCWHRTSSAFLAHHCPPAPSPSGAVCVYHGPDRDRRVKAISQFDVVSLSPFQEHPASMCCLANTAQEWRGSCCLWFPSYFVDPSITLPLLSLLLRGSKHHTDQQCTWLPWLLPRRSSQRTACLGRSSARRTAGCAR
jgi:hypothetical protein